MDNELLSYMSLIRRTLHASPELGYMEVKTAEIISRGLREIGISHAKGVAETGIFAPIEGGQPGPTIAFRADMDGLPIEEKNNVPYKSKNPGVMHACGHDGHMAILLGLAKLLSRERANFRGNILLIFQPAEEGGAGGKKIAESDVYATYKPDKIFGLHLWNEYPVGTVLARPGLQQAGSRQVSVIFEGPGGHAAYLYKTQDAIKAATLLSQELESIPRKLFPWHELPIIHVGYFHAGTAANVVASKAEIRCTIRVHEKRHLDIVTREIKRRAKLIAKQEGLPPPTITHTDGYIPLLNHAKETELVLSLAKSLGYRTPAMPIKPGADDFAFFLKNTPGCYFNVGSSNRALGLTAPHHSPTFDFDEGALLVGVKVFYEIAKYYLTRTTNSSSG